MADEEQSTPPPQPAKVIVIKRGRGGGHGGHHGGAWKVAYADFVTAMMALFIVLWLMSADDEVKQSIAAYFNNPSGPGNLTGTAAAGVGNSLEIPKEDMKDLQEKIQQALMTVPNFRNLKDHVEITITSDGLRIEMLETEAGIFFESGRPVPSASGAELLTRLAQELGRLQNSILIEGHTDAKPFSGDGTYSNWELSADRANSARKLMEANGLRPDQVGQVRGYADRQLRHPEDPTSASNRRISVIVQYLAGAKAAAAREAEAKAKAAEGGAHGGEAAHGEAKTEAKTESKGEPKSPPAAENKAAPKAESKAAPPVPAQAAPKAESKAAPPVPAKAVPKAEPKAPAPAAKVEPKPSPMAVGSKAAPKAETRAPPPAEAKTPPKAEAKPKPGH
jgi:chemotaxis protein MotB